MEARGFGIGGGYSGQQLQVHKSQNILDSAVRRLNMPSQLDELNDENERISAILASGDAAGEDGGCADAVGDGEAEGCNAAPSEVSENREQEMQEMQEMRIESDLKALDLNSVNSTTALSVPSSPSRAGNAFIKENISLPSESGHVERESDQEQEQERDQDQDSDSSSIGSSSVRLSVGSGGDRNLAQRGEIEPTAQSFPGIIHRDLYVLFVTFCSWSLKGKYDPRASPVLTEPQQAQTKVLALELLLHILTTVGPVFKNNDVFIYAVRKVLCVSLLETCTAHNNGVAELSLNIFATLLNSFKDHMKNEIEVFITTIFLATLESENATFEHKMYVLSVLHRLCADHSTLVELFVNYDCDLDAIDIFRRTVDCFAKTAKQPMLPKPAESFIAITSTSREKREKEEYSLRMQALQGLVIMLSSIIKSGGFGSGILPADEIAAANDVGSDGAYNSGNEGPDSFENSGSGNYVGRQVSGDGNNKRPEDMHVGLESGATTPNVLSPVKGLPTALPSSNSSSSGGGGGVVVRVNSPAPQDPDLDTFSSSSTSISNANQHGGTSFAVSSHQTSARAVDTFDKKQRLASELETGILKFNLSSKKGLQYLIQTDHIEQTPESVARFLHQHQDRLNKTVVGDYLGREPEYEKGFVVKVLQAYVNQLDFADLPFDHAIRLFLSGFRLPGEAQKIDRLMESFAERYYLQNRTVFASADMAFILAFSTIMLQTNLHNPAIKEEKKMTKEQFVKQNKGISSDGELPESLLVDLYDRILKEPISIMDGPAGSRGKKGVPKPKAEASSFVVFQSTASRRRRSAFDDERTEMLKASQAMFSKRRTSTFVRMGGSGSGSGGGSSIANTSSNNVLVRAAAGPATGSAAVAVASAGSGGLTIDTQYQYNQFLKPMFELMWAPMLGVLSQLLDAYDDPALVELCLTGFQCSIRLACRLDFPFARRAYINSLVNFTGLDAIRNMVTKNIESIKVLLSIAMQEGNHLDDSWATVLQCISQLARLQVFGQGLRRDDVFFADPNSNSNTNTSNRINFNSGRSPNANGRGGGSAGDGGSTDSSSGISSWFGPSKAESERLVEEANAETVTRELQSLSIDDLYLNSITLTAQSVQHFVRSLCEVSLLEISSSRVTMNQQKTSSSSSEGNTQGVPRVFSLQKLVEVADYNMHTRSRLEWTHIWSLLAHHFTNVGMYDNHHLAMYAIDSLRQLSIKFLGKAELSNFSFQRVFLKPFEIIVSNSKDNSIKDLILNCVDVMIRACSQNIRSGWRSILSILEHASQQPDGELALTAFNIVDRLVTSSFTLLISDFTEVVTCLLSFVASNHIKLSFRALQLLAVCAEHLAKGDVLAGLESAEGIPVGTGGESESITPSAVVSPVEATDAAIASTASAVCGTSASAVVDEDGRVFRLWWPLLLGLSAQVANDMLQVRLRALETLQNVLCAHGSVFSPQAWSVIFKGVLFPILDSAKTDPIVIRGSAYPTEYPPMTIAHIDGERGGSGSSGSSGSGRNSNIDRDKGVETENSWTCTMALPVMISCVELYHMFRNKQDPLFLLPDIFAMIEDVICQDIECLARFGVKTFTDLVLSLAGGPLRTAVVLHDQEIQQLSEMTDSHTHGTHTHIHNSHATSGRGMAAPGHSMDIDNDDDDSSTEESCDSGEVSDADPLEQAGVAEWTRAQQLQQQQQQQQHYVGNRSSVRSRERRVKTPKGDELTTEVAVQHLCSSTLQNLALYFGDLGTLTLSQDIPESARSKLLVCPLRARRLQQQKFAFEEEKEEKEEKEEEEVKEEQRRASSQRNTSTLSSSSAAFPPLPPDAIAEPSSRRTAAQARTVNVRTPYGAGTVRIGSTAAAQSVSDVAMNVITLPWGIMYSPAELTEEWIVPDAADRDAGDDAADVDVDTNVHPEAAITKINSSSSATDAGEATHAPASLMVPLSSISQALMTSMVVSVSFIRITSELFSRHLSFLNEAQLDSMLHVLEASHWHARSFNEDTRLRNKLKEHSFMKFKHAPNRSPNLLEQEVRSVTQILKIAVTLMVISYPPTSPSTAAAGAERSKTGANTDAADTVASSADVAGYSSLSQKWFTLYAPIVLARFMDLDDTLSTASPVASDLVLAYKPAVLYVMQGLTLCSIEQFNKWLFWVGPILARLVLCHDREIRTRLSVVYSTHVLPMLVCQPAVVGNK